MSDITLQPILLHAVWGTRHCSVSGDGEWKHEESDIEVKLGKLYFMGFYDIEITRIDPDCITFVQGKEPSRTLIPGGRIHFSAEIEGREWSDGCVYDSDDYSLTLTWATSNP